MIDLRLVTDRPEEVLQRLSLRGEVPGTDRVADLGTRRRSLIHESEGLRRELRSSGENLKELLARDPAAAADLRAKLKASSARQKQLDEELKRVEGELSDLLLLLPNLPHESVPHGKSAEENPVVRVVGKPPVFGFAPKPHWELGENLAILDFARAAKVSGSRFAVLMGKGARLEHALIQFMLSLHVREHGYKEVLTPFIVSRDSMVGTGQLPKFEEEAFKTTEPEFFLIPTAEVPVTNLHRDEILDAEQMPLKYVAFSPCFRREAGAAGRDTRGLIRLHQFNKVELVKFTAPESSYAELESLTADAEDVLKRLGLHYRVISLCAGDLGFSSAKTYDLEVWMPGQQRFVEISSCSNFEAFQARRARIRFRRAQGDKPELAHTLNGSGLAIGRTMAAVLESYQQEDGSVVLPEVLVPHAGFAKIER